MEKKSFLREKKRKMKVSWLLFLLLLSIIAIPNVSMAQNNNENQTLITVKKKQATLEEVIMQIEATTPYGMAFRKEILPTKKRDYHIENLPISEVMNQLTKETDLAWTRTGSIITIFRKSQQTSPPQDFVNIRGVVSDEKGEPIVGAVVILKGTQIGVATDANGKFNLRVPASSGSILVISHIGQLPVEITYKGEEELKVRMKEDVTTIDDVVVTGIFTRQKETYTGSVSSIKREDLKTFRGQNLVQTLRNIDPSINIIIDNESGSNPNVPPQINIRGNSTLPMSIEDYNASASNLINTPLIVMDGFEISLSRLMDYNDDEIESINILKDAAATAIYGSRGANGVIVIVSRAPAQGKLKLSVSGSWDLEIPDLDSYDLLNAEELLQLQKKVGAYDASYESAYNWTMKIYRERLKNVAEGVNTDWLHYPVRTGVSQRYNARIEGGSNEFRWATTLGFNRTEGVMKGSQRDVFNGSVLLSYTYQGFIFRNQLSIGANKGVESPYGSFDEFVKMRPYDRPYDDDGKLIPTFARDYSRFNYPLGNPLYNASLNQRNDSRYTEITNNFSIDWNIITGLYLRGRFGISNKENKKDLFLPPSHTSFDTQEYNSNEGAFRKGRYTYNTGTDLNWDLSATLNYSHSFKEFHHIYAGVDFSMRQQRMTNYQIVVEGFTNDHQDFFGNAMQYLQNGIPTGSESTSRSVGFTATANYSCDNRYFADLSYRLDGSSQFGSNSQFAPFWSAGIGWNIHNEKFMKSIDAINNLRIRATYGVTGSQNFSAYQAQAIYSYFSDNKYLNRTGIYLMGISNDELRWQTTHQTNLGFDLELLNRRLQVSFDYYIKDTKGLLSSMPLPRSTGYSSFIDNIGKVRNSGFEVSASTYIINNPQKSDWVWMVSAKLAYNKNEIIKLSESIKEQTEQYKQQDVEVSNLFYEGYSQNSIWAVRSLGIDPSTGEELFFDADGNITTVWHPGAKIYCGVGEPKFRGNATSMLRYKDFSFTLNFGYHWGGQVTNSTLRDKVEVSNDVIIEQNVDRRVLSARWGEVGDITFFKGHSNKTTRATSRFVMDDKVFQLQTASLQYRLSQGAFLQKIKMDAISFSVNVSDLFYISSVKRERGTSYPFARRAGISVALQF